MGVPLTTLTYRPVHNDHNVRQFGGDDTQLKLSGLFGTIVQWDADAKDDVFKANFVFMMKKAFAFLDKIGLGTCIYGEEGLEGCIRYYEAEWIKCQATLELNRLAREKIIRALGGVAECQKIPVVDFNRRDLQSHLSLNDEYLSGGQHIVRLTDPFGRTAVVMHLRDKTREVYTATAHQLYRETSNRGNEWALNFDKVYPGAEIYSDTDRVAKFIEEVRTHQHKQFSFLPKPYDRS